MRPGLLVPAGEDRLDPRDFPAVVPKQGGVLELPALLLDPQIQALMLEVTAPRTEFLVGQFLEFLDFLHSSISIS